MAAPYAPLLARIDDRLIHGQVVVGCCEPLKARRILLVDDAVAADPLQQKLYRSGVPPEVDVDFAAVSAASSALERLDGEGELGSLVVVVARAKVMGELDAHGIRFRCVQLGGAHARPGASELVPGYFVDAEDRRALRQLLHAGTEILVQPVARSASIPVVARMLGEEGA